MTQDALTKSSLQVRAKVWLEADEEYIFGLGICRILEAVAETGSIKRAAAAIGKSYRHTWARIKKVEEQLGVSLVETRVGGSDAHRSDLTAAAQTLVKEYRRLRADVFQLVEQRFNDAIRDAVATAVRTSD